MALPFSSVPQTVFQTYPANYSLQSQFTIPKKPVPYLIREISGKISVCVRLPRPDYIGTRNVDIFNIRHE
jgi:hypothetical protein